jgi:hypothetical protein
LETLELKQILQLCLVPQVLLTLLLLKKHNLKQNQRRYLGQDLVVLLLVLEVPHLVVLLLDQLEVLANQSRSHPILLVQTREHNLCQLPQGLDKTKLLLKHLKVLEWARHLKGKNQEVLEDLLAWVELLNNPQATMSLVVLTLKVLEWASPKINLNLKDLEIMEEVSFQEAI